MMVQRPPYPITRKVEQYDDYFGTIVHDPYRWLEEENSDEVVKWVAEQNKFTESYLDQIPFRDAMRRRIEELVNYPRCRSVRKIGDRYFFLKNDGLQERSVLYVQDGRNGTPQVFLDPNALSDGRPVSMQSHVFSNDDRFLTFSLSDSGSEWSEVRVIDVATGEPLEDRVSGVYSPPTWLPHWHKDGFYYCRLDDPATGQRSSGESSCRIYYHTLGTTQEEDDLIFEDKANPHRSYVIVTTRREILQFLVAFDPNHPGNLLYVRDMRTRDRVFEPFYTQTGQELLEIEEVDGKILLMTDLAAPTYRIVLADPQNSDPKFWKEIIPAREQTIESAHFIGGKIVVVYSHDASNHVYVHDLDGSLSHELELPAIGSVEGIWGNYDEPKVFFEFSGFTTPKTIYEHDLLAKRSTVFRKSEVPFDIGNFVTEQIFYPGSDGVLIPMFLVSMGNLLRDGPRPTILTAYGGFNDSPKPLFHPAMIAFIEQGGALAQAHVRGGGEYGKRWHEAGARLNKQNTFNDVIAAADYLFGRHITDRNHLALAGSSNGGLVVGAVITQRPDLCAVALPNVGVFDMLRFQKLGGLDWIHEYGSSENPSDFANLYQYSPLHRISHDRSYPSTLVRTAERDDRVLPAHSYKFLARLQECQTSSRPVLLAVEMETGHGRGMTISKAIRQVADDYAFLFHELQWPVSRASE